MKAALFGGEDQKLRAADLRNPSKGQLNGLEIFFTTYGFFRFGVMVSDTVQNETDFGLIKLAGRMVLDRIAEIAGYAHPVDVVIITESSDSIGRELMAYGTGELKYYAAERISHSLEWGYSAEYNQHSASLRFCKHSCSCVPVFFKLVSHIVNRLNN